MKKYRYRIYEANCKCDQNAEEENEEVIEDSHSAMVYTFMALPDLWMCLDTLVLSEAFIKIQLQ